MKAKIKKLMDEMISPLEKHKIKEEYVFIYATNLSIDDKYKGYKCLSDNGLAFNTIILCNYDEYLANLMEGR